VATVDADGYRVGFIIALPNPLMNPVPMANELRMALADVLRKAGVEDADFLREGMPVLAQELMDIEVEQHLGAARHERTERHRNAAVLSYDGEESRPC
jgi:hypothetical protein